MTEEMIDEILADLDDMTSEERKIHEEHSKYIEGWENAHAEWLALEPERQKAREERLQKEIEQRRQEELVSEFLPTLRGEWRLNGRYQIENRNHSTISEVDAEGIDPDDEAWDYSTHKVYKVEHKAIRAGGYVITDTIEAAYDVVEVLDKADTGLYSVRE